MESPSHAFLYEGGIQVPVSKLKSSPKARPKLSLAVASGPNDVVKLNKNQRRRRNKKLRKAAMQKRNAVKRTMAVMGSISVQARPRFSLPTAARPNGVVKLNKKQRHRRNKKLRKAAMQKRNIIKRIMLNASKAVCSVKDMTTMGFINVHRFFLRRHFGIPQTGASSTPRTDICQKTDSPTQSETLLDTYRQLVAKST